MRHCLQSVSGVSVATLYDPRLPYLNTEPVKNPPNSIDSDWKKDWDIEIIKDGVKIYKPKIYKPKKPETPNTAFDFLAKKRGKSPVCVKKLKHGSAHRKKSITRRVKSKSKSLSKKIKRGSARARRVEKSPHRNNIKRKSKSGPKRSSKRKN